MQTKVYTSVFKIHINNFIPLQIGSKNPTYINLWPINRLYVWIDDICIKRASWIGGESGWGWHSFSEILIWDSNKNYLKDKI